MDGRYREYRGSDKDDSPWTSGRDSTGVGVQPEGGHEDPWISDLPRLHRLPTVQSRRDSRACGPAQNCRRPESELKRGFSPTHDPHPSPVRRPRPLRLGYPVLPKDPGALASLRAQVLRPVDVDVDVGPPAPKTGTLSVTPSRGRTRTEDGRGTSRLGAGAEGVTSFVVPSLVRSARWRR